MRIRMHLLALAALSIIAGCGGDSTSPSSTNNNNNNQTGTPTADVTVYNNYYSPASLTISKGTVVTWTWASQGVDHTVTFDDGPTSDQIATGTYSRTFTAAGTYAYHCVIHGTAMSGTVTVQ